MLTSEKVRSAFDLESEPAEVRVATDGPPTAKAACWPED